MLALEARQVPGTLRYRTRRIGLAELGERLGLSRGTVCRQVNDLAKLGWLRRDVSQGGTRYSLPRHPEPANVVADNRPAGVVKSRAGVALGDALGGAQDL